MKKSILIGLSVVVLMPLVGILATQVARSEDLSPAKAVEALFPEKNSSQQEAKQKAGIEDLTESFSDMEKSLESAETRLEQIEERLGPVKRRPTLATSFERRLEDLEKRLGGIERQISKLQNLENRVRKLERKN